MTFIVLGVAAAQDDLHTSVSSPRPLADAVLQIHQRLGVAVNFEEVHHLYPRDIADVTDEVLRTRTPEQLANSALHPVRVFVPRGGDISLDWSGFNKSINSGLQLLQNLVSQNTSNGLPGTYGVTFENGAFYITPTQAKDSSGSWQATKSVLETKVTLPSQRRTEAQTLIEINRQVSEKTGVEIHCCNSPLRMGVTIGAQDEPARNVITRVLGAVRDDKFLDGTRVIPISYHLLFDPQLKVYVLNVLGFPEPDPPAPIRSRPTPKSVPPGTPTPFGVRRDPAPTGQKQ